MTSPVRYGSARGRWVLAATVLGSGMAFLDATVVNIALAAIGRDLGAGFRSLQWTVNAYSLALAGLLLVGGSLGDRLGRRRVFLAGTVWFAVASVACAAAPSMELLIGARALQGVGAALLTPGSLAILQATFAAEDRAAAIGAWSGLSGVATAVGPFAGGWIVDVSSWRLIFLINLPFAAAVVAIGARHVPETRDSIDDGGGLDLAGATVAAVGLAGVVYALTEGPRGWTARPLAAGAVGLVALALFPVLERRHHHPLVPPRLFASRQFSGANAVTLVVYAALGGALFLVPITLQRVAGYSALESGTALLPLTVVMLVLSPRAGRLLPVIGARAPMTVGPIVAGAGLALLSRAATDGAYASRVLPGIVVFAVGLSFTVAPLTATVLAAAPADDAGIASAINSDIARIGGLLAVALMPSLAGLTTADDLPADVLAAGFRTATFISAGLCIFGGLLSFALIDRATTGASVPIAGCPISAPLPAVPDSEPPGAPVA